jgi:hypothetical protein
MKSLESGRAPSLALSAGRQPNPLLRAFIASLLVYVVLVSALPRYFTPQRYGVSVAVLLPLALSLGGWLTWRPSPVFVRYMVAAGAFSIWTMISGIAAWDGQTLYDSFAFSVWFVVIVPGLGFLMRQRTYRWAFAVGFVATMVTYGSVVGYRVAVGHSVLDVEPTGDLVAGGWILGRNRNLVSMGAMVALPLLLEKVGPRFVVRLRWPLIAVCAASVLYGGGRAGLLGLGAIGLLHALLRPDATRRVRRSLVAVLAGWMFLLVSQSIGGSIGVATDRLTGYLAGERDHSAEVRELAVRKGWHIALEHPVFGVGFAHFQSVYHPVVEDTDDSDVYHDATRATAHMTYAQAIAELGFPGGISFVVLILVLLTMGAGRSWNRDVRAATASFGAVAVMIAFDAVLGGFVVFHPMAFILGAIFSVEDAPTPAPAGTSPVE